MISADQYSRYATLCLLAYPPVFDHRKYGFAEQRLIHDKYRYAFSRLVWNDDEVVLVFRGTRNFFTDWMTNLQAWPAPHKFGEKRLFTHAGFARALNTWDVSQAKPAFDYLVEVLFPLLDERPERKLVLTGHSLGGALAVLAALRLHNQRPGSVSAVFTYGQPAVGGRGFRKAYTDVQLSRVTHRICKGIDAVTFLPGPGYRHVGTGYWLHDDKIHINPQWYTRILRSIFATMTSFVRHHSIKKYITYRPLFER